MRKIKRQDPEARPKRPIRSMERSMDFTLKIWRQKSRAAPGGFESFPVKNISPASSFLEMLDALNEGLVSKGLEPVAFEHDCREGICGACGMVINGEAHGPVKAVTACQVYMRSFQSGSMIVIEPFRAKAFPVIKDLVIDRSALDRIQQAGGYISVQAGSAPEAHSTPVPKQTAHTAFAAAACIGCGACVSACKNSSASLFAAARLSHLNSMPQGLAEKDRRTLKMTRRMDKEGFGACSHTEACFAVCPKEIDLRNIALMQRAYIKAVVKNPAPSDT